MPSLAAQNIIDQINQYCRNYGPEFFHNSRGNSILNQIVALVDANSGGVTASSQVLAITSADFSNATDCPLTLLDGINLQIYYCEGNKWLEKDLGEWTDLAGGGFTILITGFNSADDNYHFKIFQSP
jgi:hypothetical protein